MPIYEFRCEGCDTTFNILVRTYHVSPSPICPECGSKRVERLMSTFSYHRSTSDILQEAGEPALSPQPNYYKDPRTIGRWTEKRFKQLGLDIPPEINRQIQTAREGEFPARESEMLGL